MSNMSYCRFENTYRDLVDCYENLLDSDLSEREKMFRQKLIKVCQDILTESLDEDTIEEFSQA